MKKAKGNDTIADIISALELHNEAVDISTLDEQETKSID